MKRRCIAAALALGMTLLPLAGCAQNKPGQNTPAASGQEPAAGDGNLVTLTASLPSQGKNRVWGNDDVTEEFTRLTNTQLKITWYQNLSEIDTQLASGELADLTVFNPSLTKKLEDKQYTLAWDELAPQYTPEFWDSVPDETKAYCTAADGHIYSLRFGLLDDTYYEADHAAWYGSAAALSYRQDLAEQLDLKDFTSLEDFESVLYDVKARADELGIEYVLYANGLLTNDNLADSAYNGHRTVILDWMGVHQDRWWDNEAKKVSLPYRDEAWLTYLKKMNQWYHDGILHYLEMGALHKGNNFQTVTQLEMALPKTFAFSFSAPFIRDMNISLHHRSQGGNPEDLSKPVLTIQTAPLTWEGEIRTQPVDISRGFFSTYIANTCTNPRKAMEFVAFAHGTEGDRLLTLGIEGKHYDMTEEGLPLYRDEYLYKKDSELAKTSSSFAPTYWGNILGSGRAYTLYNASYAVNEEDDIDRITTQALLDFWKDRRVRTQKDPALALAQITMDDPEYAMVQQMLTLWNTTIGQLIQAESPSAVEEGWKDLQNQLSALGMDQVEATLTQRYLEQEKKFLKK